MFLKPLAQLHVTSKFGPRLDPKSKKPSFHSGIDLRAAVNTPCYAVADGTVVVSKVNSGGVHSGYGYYMVIQHDGFYVIYAHLAKLGSPVGTKVKELDQVAVTGNTGYSTGPHLHFEVRIGTYNNTSFIKNVDGMMPNAVDPETFKIEQKYERILKAANVDVDRWLAYIKSQSTNGTGKFLPELIVKVYNANRED
jgi:murein DD-endopeptidase MepM/ murein hydrolase activator NlpD